MPTNKDTSKNTKSKSISKVVREPGTQKYYVTNIVGGATKYDYRIDLMNEKVRYKNGWTYLVDSIVIMTPSVTKKLHRMLGKYIENYEKEKGEIAEPDDIEKEEPNK